MIRCLIIDDEPLAIRVLEHLLSEVPDVEIVGTHTRPLEAAARIREQPVDLLFLDIQMPGLSGLDFVRSLSEPPLVVFTTAHREHAVEGFEINAVDYLVKPVALPRLLKALDRVRLRMHDQHAPASGDDPGGHAMLHVRADRRTLSIRTDSIRYAESLGDYVVLHAGGRPVTTRMTMTELSSALEPQGFVRIHRSTLVNPSYVTAWSTAELRLGDTTLRVGRSYRSDVARRIPTAGK